MTDLAAPDPNAQAFLDFGRSALLRLVEEPDDGEAMRDVRLLAAALYAGFVAEQVTVTPTTSRLTVPDAEDHWIHGAPDRHHADITYVASMLHRVTS